MPINVENLQGIWKLQTDRPNLISTITFTEHYFSKITVEKNNLTEDCDNGKMELRNLDNETTHIYFHPNMTSNTIVLTNVILEGDILQFTLNGNNLIYNRQ